MGSGDGRCAGGTPRSHKLDLVTNDDVSLPLCVVMIVYLSNLCILYISICCSPGDEYDPANCLVLNHGWRGIFIEGVTALAEQARASLGDQVRVLSASVTPSDVGPA